MRPAVKEQSKRRGEFLLDVPVTDEERDIAQGRRLPLGR